MSYFGSPDVKSDSNSQNTVLDFSYGSKTPSKVVSFSDPFYHSEKPIDNTFNSTYERFVSPRIYGLETTSSEPDLSLSTIPPAVSHSSSSGKKDLVADVKEKKYLNKERRSIWGQASYNAGYSYFGAVFTGGVAGVINGLLKTPNMRPRVVLNSILNHAGRYGARFGNAAGVFAVVFTMLERFVEDVGVERLPSVVNRIVAPVYGGHDLFVHNASSNVVPYTTAFLAGSLFCLPRAAAMKGIDRLYVTFPKRVAVVGLGGLTATAGVAVVGFLGPLLFGDHTPFKFS